MNANEVNLSTINYVSGSIAGPLVKSLWEMSDCNPDVPKRLHLIFNRLSAYGLEREALEILRLLHEILCISFPESISRLYGHTEAQNCFLSELLLDIDDIAQELAAEE